MTMRRWISEVLHVVVFAVLIFILLIPWESLAVIRAVVAVVVVGSWYVGRYRMEWLGLGGLVLMLLHEAEYLGLFSPALASWSRLVWPMRALGLGFAILFLLIWIALQLSERYRMWFMMAVFAVIVVGSFLRPSPFVFKVLTFVVSHFWYALAAVTLGKRRAEQEQRSWIVSGMIPFVWSPRWVPIPVILSRQQFVMDQEERYRLQWKGLGLIVLSSAMLYIEKTARIANGGYVQSFWQWFIMGSFQANQAVGLAWVSGMRIGIATGNFLNTATLSGHFTALLRYYTDALEQFFIAPIFARLRSVRTFHWRVFWATFLGIFLGGLYIHLTTVLVVRREFRFPPPGIRIFSLYPHDSWHLLAYFLFIALGVAVSITLQVLRPKKAAVSLPRRVILSLCYFTGYALAVMFAFYPADLDVLWRFLGGL